MAEEFIWLKIRGEDVVPGRQALDPVLDHVLVHVAVHALAHGNLSSHYFHKLLFFQLLVLITIIITIAEAVVALVAAAVVAAVPSQERTLNQNQNPSLNLLNAAVHIPSPSEYLLIAFSFLFYYFFLNIKLFFLDQEIVQSRSQSLDHALDLKLRGLNHDHSLNQKPNHLPSTLTLSYHIYYHTFCL